MSAVPSAPDPDYGLARDGRVARAPAATSKAASSGLPRAWRCADVAARTGEVFFELGDEARAQVALAWPHIRANGFTLATIEQEDMRLPALAREVPGLRARLDHGLGFFVLRGLPLDGLGDEEARMLAWVVSNYLGRVIRQNYTGLRVELLKDQKRSDGDPYRISQTNRFFDFHSDNGVLEPRPPNYIGLTCLHPARAGGESVLVSSYTLHDEVLARLRGATDPDPEGLLARELALSSPLVPRLAGLEAYARESFPAGRPLLDAALDLSSRIHQDFAYLPGATETGTRLEEVLRDRLGVCQDFAHLAIGCLRSLGVPARYVSGYLETEAAPGHEKLVGADVTYLDLKSSWGHDA
ncbi:MAG TPA: transglutaminase domain-containing protein, partial [Burkholderiaceae bacterium]|nr:transglutaminase domain-containing protein [Burkholderiaceae bacterium]